MRKIARLAEAGVGGEKQNAKVQLTKLLTRYDLSIDDVLKDREKHRVGFPYRTAMEKDLLLACYARATHQSRVAYYQRRRSVAFDLNPIEAAEMRSLYRYYRKLLKKEITTLAFAFQQKHGLYGPSSGDDKSTQLSEKEIMAICMMIGSLQKSEYVPANRLLEQHTE